VAARSFLPWALWSCRQRARIRGSRDPPRGAPARGVQRRSAAPRSEQRDMALRPKPEPYPGASARA
jgi:hypothetical protein